MSDYLGLVKQDPPTHHDATVPTRGEIAKVLEANAGEWFIVGTHDRMSRAETLVTRIESGREYGEGFEAVYRQVGRDHKVWARQIGGQGAII